jgi:hypothetical protein
MLEEEGHDAGYRFMWVTRAATNDAPGVVPRWRPVSKQPARA